MWRDPSRRIMPEIFALKLMMRRLQDDRQVVLYCDLHGHSRKHNVFCYGCDAGTGPTAAFKGDGAHGRYDGLVFPRLLWRNSPVFSFSDCSFKVQKSKESTARVVVRRELGIVNSFTMEATLAGCNFGRHAGKHLTPDLLRGVGHSFCDTILDYFDPDPTKREAVVEDLRLLYPSGFVGGDGDDSGSDGTPEEEELTPAVDLSALEREMKKEKKRSKKEGGGGGGGKSGGNVKDALKKLAQKARKERKEREERTAKEAARAEAREAKEASAAASAAAALLTAAGGGGGGGGGRQAGLLGATRRANHVGASDDRGRRGRRRPAVVRDARRGRCSSATHRRRARGGGGRRHGLRAGSERPRRVVGGEQPTLAPRRRVVVGDASSDRRHGEHRRAWRRRQARRRRRASARPSRAAAATAAAAPSRPPHSHRAARARTRRARPRATGLGRRGGGGPQRRQRRRPGRHRRRDDGRRQRRHRAARDPARAPRAARELPRLALLPDGGARLRARALARRRVCGRVRRGHRRPRRVVVRVGGGGL